MNSVKQALYNEAIYKKSLGTKVEKNQFSLILKQKPDNVARDRRQESCTWKICGNELFHRNNLTYPGRERQGSHFA